MPYNTKLAERVRTNLERMFKGLAFLVNGKMCILTTPPDLNCLQSIYECKQTAPTYLHPSPGATYFKIESST
jgi:hypothetical protein